MENPVNENELVARSTAERVTAFDVQSYIKSEHYFTAAEGELGRRFCDNEEVFGVPNDLEVLTFCVLVLQNGFTVVGQSACAVPENYKRDIGERIARENAEKKIWELLGFNLKSEQKKEADLLARTKFEPADDQTTYIGTKVIYAKPMTRGEYNEYRGWVLPNYELSEDPGYLVEYADDNKSNHVAHQGYISWSPKDVFERAYRPARSAKAEGASV